MIDLKRVGDGILRGGAGDCQDCQGEGVEESFPWRRHGPKLTEMKAFDNR